jgi:hypothetical protein
MRFHTPLKAVYRWRTVRVFAKWRERRAENAENGYGPKVQKEGSDSGLKQLACEMRKKLVESRGRNSRFIL